MSLNLTISVTAVTEPLNWDNAMEILSGNDCVVDAIDNPCTQDLMNNACVLEGREPKTAEMTNVVSARGGGPIPLVSVIAMGIKGKIMVYNHRGGGGG